jgi:hypothetical protein
MRLIRAFSSEVGTGSREENASKQKALDPTASILRLTVADRLPGCGMLTALVIRQ